MVRRRVTVTGEVQGVGFRWSTREQAQREGVSGFVRNLSDGTVEAEIEGSVESVDAMIAWLRRGPGAASVSDLRVEEIDETGGAGFSLRS